MYTCVAPDDVSYSSIDETRRHGGALLVGTVSWIATRISDRVAEPAVFTDWIAPEATENGDAVAVAVPAALRNVTVPAHDAAVPVDEFAAEFATLT